MFFGMYMVFEEVKLSFLILLEKLEKYFQKRLLDWNSWKKISRSSLCIEKLEEKKFQSVFCVLEILKTSFLEDLEKKLTFFFLDTTKKVEKRFPEVASVSKNLKEKNSGVYFVYWKSWKQVF